MKVTSWLARLAIALVALTVFGAGQQVSTHFHNAQIVADGGGPIKPTGG